MNATTGPEATLTNFETLRATILARHRVLPRRIAQAAAFALDNPDDIAFGTAASIAEAAGVQPSTLVRLAQHLGFDGFSSLQQVFRERLRERNSSYEERLNALRADVAAGAGHRAVLDGFLAAASTSLEGLSHSIDEGSLERAIAVLAGAETIFIVARRRSYPVATYIAYALGKLELRYQLIESAAGLEAEMVAFATGKDAALAISFSPYASATVEDARRLSAMGVPVVAITDSAFSPLAQFAKVWFEVAEADFAGFRSLSATISLAMSLAVGVAEKRRSRTASGGS